MKGVRMADGEDGEEHQLPGFNLIFIYASQSRRMGNYKQKKVKMSEIIHPPLPS